MPANARTGVRAGPQRSTDSGALRWQRTKVREASRNHAFDSPVPGEGTTPEQPGQTENSVAVFDRAVEKLRVVETCELKDCEELPAVLKRNKVVLVE
jgi:hypothetical protein